VRVVIGEDLTLLRDGLVRLLTAYDLDVVEAVDSGPALLRALITQRPDVAIVDIRLPPSWTDEGLQVAIAARAQIPGLPILIPSGHVQVLYAHELIADGRGGVVYLLKDRVADVVRFVESVRVVAAGGTVLDPEVVSEILARHTHREPLSHLTAREREVPALMAEGHANTGIGTRLLITEKAVSKHINNISPNSTCAPTRTAIAVLAYLNA
jgi:DNA-binding NarL/FixJ family response regulator